MDKSERRWVWIFAGVVMLVTTIPYLAGFSSEGTDWSFSGFVFGVEDGNSYIAKMLSGSIGAWSFRTPYTIEHQRGVLAFLPYIILGKFAQGAAIHEQLIALFHLYRILAGLLEVFATYQFIAYFIMRVHWRRMGLILATLGGGLGWLLVLLGKTDWLGTLPLDFYSPETFGFLGLYGLPHLALARSALLWGLLAFMSALRNPDSLLRKSCIKIGLLWILVILAQPLTGLIMGGILGLYWLGLVFLQFGLRYRYQNTDKSMIKRGLFLLVGSGLLPAPFLLYNFFAFTTDPFLKQWTAQNLILSPHPLHYVVAYGTACPFAIWGGLRMFRKKPETAILPISWVLALPLLAYAPVNLQRRLPEGIWVALVALAVYAFDNCEQSSGKIGRGWAWILIVPSMFSSMILLSGGWMTAKSQSVPVFLPGDETDAFDFIAAQAKPGEVVLSSFQTGNALPAWADVRVVVGHGPESVGLAELNPLVQMIYDSSTSDSERLRLLDLWDVEFLFRGPQEAALGDWDPNQAGYLIREFQAGVYEVFRVLGR
jgi:hypothetical protein